jgi:PKD repeat protein
MRKFYLLFTLILGFLSHEGLTQDHANFNFSIGPNNVVNFSNTSVLQSTELRRAHWFFGDGTKQVTSPLAGTQHQYANGGVYTVCLKIYKYTSAAATDSFVTADICKVVTLQNTVADSCGADFTLQPVTASPLSRIFVAAPFHNHTKKPLKICWQFGDGHDTCIYYTTASTGPYTVKHTYAAPGQYNMCVKINYDGGCEKQKCKLETVSLPVVNTCSVQVNEVATTSNILDRHFYATPMLNAVPLKICWYFGDGTDSCIILQHPLNTQSLLMAHHYPAPGTYHLCVKMWYDGGCVADRCIEIHVNSNTNLCGGYMTDSTYAPRTVKLRGFSIMNPNDHVIGYKWTFGDGTNATGQQVVHTYASPGNYQVCLVITTDLGCETKICKHIIFPGTQSPLVLSPNPVINMLHVAFNSIIQENVSILIYNGNGVLVRNYTRFAVAGGNGWDLDLSTLPPGIYSVVISSPNQLANAIFFKQ